jgi:hypothetical protein
MAYGKSVQAFGADLDAFAKALELNIGIVARRVTLDIHGRVSDISPVDTGRFRASWGIHPHSIPSDSGAAATTGEPDSVALSEQQGRIVMNDREDPYTVWWVYNNLPYAQALENGHSGQAPSGVLALALAGAEADVLSTMDRLM